jgi:hypothetical protein
LWLNFSGRSGLLGCWVVGVGGGFQAFYGHEQLAALSRRTVDSNNTQIDALWCLSLAKLRWFSVLVGSSRRGGGFDLRPLLVERLSATNWSEIRADRRRDFPDGRRTNFLAVSASRRSAAVVYHERLLAMLDLGDDEEPADDEQSPALSDSETPSDRST